MINALMHSMTVCPDMDKKYSQIEYGRGIYLYDNKGRKFIDSSSGKAAAANIGHGINEIGKVLSEQARKVSLYPTHFFSSKIVEDYLQNLVDFAPAGFEKAWITTSGTDAVESAVKLAVQFHALNGEPGRFKVISRWGSYHGSSFFNLDIGGMRLRRDLFQKSMYGFSHIEAAYSYRKPPELTEEEYSHQCSKSLEDAILQEGPETVAAFIVEPVVAAALGAVPPPHNSYLKEIRRICTKYSVLLIVDEVLTGFGRLGSNFGIELYDITPDIIASGKGISGGYFPMSAIIIHRNVSDVFLKNNAAFLSGCTYACNPMAAAVGNFVIEYIKEKKLISNSNIMGALLYEKLQVLYEHEIVGDIRGKGLLLGIEFVQNKATKEPFPPALNVSSRITTEAMANGVILYPGKGSVDGYAGDHLLIIPPLIIEEKHLDEIVEALALSIHKVSGELIKVGTL